MSSATVKTLSTLLLLLSLLIPAGTVAQALSGQHETLCSVVDDSGAPCCEPTASDCCCDASPAELPAEEPVVPPLPSSPSGARDAAAALPQLLVEQELPRIAEWASATAFFGDRAPSATVPATRLCVLRCSLLI